MSLAHRVDTFRAMRAELEAGVLPLATSLDGRRFSFQAGVNGLALRLGGYAMLEGDGESSLAQVRSLELAEVEIGQVTLGAEGADAIGLHTRVPIRLARGDGVLLDQVVAAFHDRLARPATAAEVRAWLAAAAPRRSRLAVGSLSLVDDAPFSLDAGGFDRHTFLCGQSGSGKTLLARPGPRAAAAGDRPAYRDPRPQLRLRAPARGARRRRPADRSALGGAWPGASACGRRRRPAMPGCGCGSPSSTRPRRGRCCGSTRSATARSTPSSPRSSPSSVRRASPS